MAQSTADGAERRAAVIGAGIIGTCCALYLQREGFQVTLIDKGAPGEGCTLGNSGGLGIASVVPLSVPGILAKVPRMLLDPLQPLTIRWADLPRSLPWLIRFLANSARGRVEEVADARNALLSKLFDAYAPLLAEAGAEDLIKRNGALSVHERENGHAADHYETDLRRRRGIRVEAVSGDEVREMEPALGPAIKGGLFFPDNGHTVNPQRLAQAFAEQAVRNGATLLRETAQGFEMGAVGPRRVVTDAGAHDADLVVLAAGAWSRPLAAKLGARVPLQAMRGYHTMMPEPGVKLNRLVSSAERRLALTSMEHGLRASGTAEFADVDAPPNYARADLLTPHAQKLLPGLNTAGATRWMGSRPAMPDSRPVIGRSLRHPNVLFAFGHDQIGIALGGITGKLIAELAAGRPPSVDLAPYRPDRF